MDYTRVIAEFTDAARREFPREACGLVVVLRGRPRLVLCANRAADPVADFEIDPQDYADAELQGDVVGVIHSHPGGTAQPSGMDLTSHAASGLTWWIVGLAERDAEPDLVELPAAEARLPLKGRQFLHGVVDCFTLIRDWYWQERGIRLPDFAREDNWWDKGQDLYVENYASAGFVALADGAEIQPGDILLMNIGSNKANHGAVYIGNNTILHHLHGRLSCQEVYTGFYRDRTRLKLRYSHDPS